MNMKKYKSSSNIVTMALVLCILFVLVLGMVKLSGAKTDTPSKPVGGAVDESWVDPYTHITSDEHAENGPLPGFSDNEKTSPDNVFNYRLNEKPYFASAAKEGEVLIENPKGNYYLMQVEYEDEYADICYRSGIIKPGQHIKNATLIANLAEGRYEATAIISAIDPDTMEVVDVVEHGITISVGNKK